MSPIGITSVLIRAKPNGSTVGEIFARKRSFLVFGFELPR